MYTSWMTERQTEPAIFIPWGCMAESELEAGIVGSSPHFWLADGVGVGFSPLSLGGLFFEGLGGEG